MSALPPLGEKTRTKNGGFTNARIVGSSVWFNRMGMAIEAIRKLHNPREYMGDGTSYRGCVECSQLWPCATEQAIAEAEAF